MKLDTLQNISGLLSEAKNKLDEMEVFGEDAEDVKANWIYRIDDVESELDTVIEAFEEQKQ